MFRAVVFFLLLGPAFGQVHRVPVADQWFPSDPAALKQILDRTFTVAEKRIGRVPPRKKLLGIVAPHAALAYSGAVAAAAYSRMDHPKNVILLGFSHRVRTAGILAPAIDAYQSPLGEIRVNREALAQLGFERTSEARLCDHSLENQLPFVQRAAPGATVVPLYVGELTEAEFATAAKKLARRLRQGDVIVASSDFTHYGKAYGYEPFPNDAQLPLRLRGRFVEAIENIGTLDVDAFDSYVARTRDTVCGWAPIRLLVAALANWSEEVFLTPLDFVTSGDLTRDYSTSVSYGALAFYPFSAFTVGEPEQASLLRSARATLQELLTAGKKAPAHVPPEERGAELEQRAGVFVTLKKRGQLRGCMGEFGSRRPIWAAVPDRTLAAATEDPRFPPLSASEGPVKLEISLLTPLKKIGGWRDFKLGQGAVLELDGRSATFLPQIAAENGWSREQLLSQLAVKAGLPPDAYKIPRAKLYVYSAQVFSEEESRHTSQ